MKYRRLLPMLVGDEHDLGSAFDGFDLSNCSKIASSSTKNDDRKVTVSNVSNRVTSSQLQSFFGKFGKVIAARLSTFLFFSFFRCSPVTFLLKTEGSLCMRPFPKNTKTL